MIVLFVVQDTQSLVTSSKSFLNRVKPTLIQIYAQCIEITKNVNSHNREILVTVFIHKARYKKV